MKVAILTCILGNFDTPVDPVAQQIPEGWEIDFHRFTDEDFPPITGLTPRLQYRIPKTHGWEMYPDYDVYIWLDGSLSLSRSDSVEWLLEQLGDADMALFNHPARQTVKQEVAHIEEHLQKGKPYITSRYKNGLHIEQYLLMSEDPDFKDDVLYTSTVFVYRNTSRVRQALRDWWYYGSRYFTCDQIQLPYIIQKHRLRVNILPGNQYKHEYIGEVSKHS